MRTPVPFDLDLTVRSHGFYDLAPWSWDPARRVLARPLLLGPGRAVHAEVAERGGPGGGLAVRLTAEGRLTAAESDEARRQLSAALGLDEDLAPFYALVRGLAGRQAPPLPDPPPLRRGGKGRAARDPLAFPSIGQRATRRDRLPDLLWAAERGAGRMLRSPTVFEDAVKTLCTTNCSWALTRAMTSKLVSELGEPAPGGGRTFPTAAAMASRSERFYRDVIRAGYRAPFLAALAREVASGALDLETWRGSALDTAALGARIAVLAGFGPYATEHLLRLLGRHDHLALDSWTRAKLARLRGRRRQPTDRAIRRWYAPFGRYAGLAMWLEVTADWHQPNPAWP
ncbi:MAG TPA: Fe-S cluster assembly protein HesB [Anaeromyxobacteraceae bacterium]|jgi:N-glycosylase/DNA lyase|nr:Fe-S cluster assembly protein HesB [Anaeromyxobacteraceae bacterium]